MAKAALVVAVMTEVVVARMVRGMVVARAARTAVALAVLAKEVEAEATLARAALAMTAATRLKMREKIQGG